MNQQLVRCGLLQCIVSAIAVLAVSVPAGATLIAQYSMDPTTQLVNSVGNFTGYNPDLVDPGGSGSPTYLPTGGYKGSGAFQFDGVANQLNVASPGYTFINQNNLDWTVSFWIKTTDSAVNLSYDGTPEIPIFGNDSGSVAFGLGIDGGTAAYRRYDGGWQTAAGATNVADGLGHFVTFVAVGSSNLSIYVDGILDTGNLSVPPAGGSQYAVNIGRSYTGHFGAFTLDDLRIYDNALSAAEVDQLFAVHIPEPSTVGLFGMGAWLVYAACRRRLRLSGCG
ncbi:MAG: LamG domain-containing protein [Planctomycetes bacterium]|nr:LamG domain-containing protein [Planctomycetota bacterium]